MGITMNGPSGIDTAGLIDQLVELERTKVYRVEAKVADYQVKIDAYSKLQSLIKDLQFKAAAIKDDSDFNMFSTDSSNEDVATVSASIGGVEGKYGLQVHHLAASEKMVTSDGLIASQTEALSAYGISAGEISINGTTLTIEDVDTIQDVRAKINNATDASGNKLGVTASVLKVSDNNYRLVLSSNETGATGADYQDVTGTTLQDLGIIQDATGAKGNVGQVIQSSGSLQAAFDSLAVGDVIEFAGTDHAGNAVSGSFSKKSTDTIDDFLTAVENSYNGMVDASIGAGGELVVTDKVLGTSRLSMGTLSVGGAAETMSTTQVGQQGSGVLSAGSDAYFSIDGLRMSDSTNSPEGIISGVTLHLHSTSQGETVQVGLKRDLDGLTEKVQKAFDSYNAVVRFGREQTQWSDPEEGTGSRGALTGDMTVRSILNQVRSVFHQQFEVGSGEYTRLTSIGAKTNTGTGEISLDKDTLRNALEKNFDEVVKLFVTNGYSDVADISHGRHTDETQSGVYRLEEIDADHFRIQLEGDTNWYVSEARSSDVISFSEGPAAGLSITAPTGSVGGTGATYTFSRGFGETLEGMARKLTDGEKGLVALRQESWRKTIDRSKERIGEFERSIEAYRLRLVNQFSHMEKVMSQMRSQQSNMMGQLGFR